MGGPERGRREGRHCGALRHGDQGNLRPRQARDVAGVHLPVPDQVHRVARGRDPPRIRGGRNFTGPPNHLFSTSNMEMIPTHIKILCSSISSPP